MSAAVTRFVEVARRGSVRGAAHGEKIANQIAKALHAIGDDVALLDYGVIDGLCELIRMMAGPWPTADVKSAIYELVRRAANARR